MKLVILSDTHEQHRRIKVPEGDVLIHCGDFTGRGDLSAINDFAQWMKSLNFSKKILVSGNHELSLEGQNRHIALNFLQEAGIIYLENSEVIIDGIKFYGSPQNVRFFDWAFNVDPGPKIAKYWNAIPDDIDVLITHMPPQGILDDISHKGQMGCKELRRRIRELKNLKLHAFGHFHREKDWIKKLEIDGVKFINASILNNAYELVNEPIVEEI